MKHFIAEVRNLKDEWESGRVQVRVYGRHDDEENIKDEDLPWAMPLQPITSAATGRMGTSPTGMIVGSRVFGYFLDEAEQYPVIVGTFARAGKQKTEDDNTLGKDDIDQKYSDVPLHARGSDKPNTQSKTLNEKETPIDFTADVKYNKAPHQEESKGVEPTGTAKKKYSDTHELPTTASVDKSKVTDIFGLIQQVDSSNKSGILPQAPQALQQLTQLSSMTSGGGIPSLNGGALGGVLGNIANELGLGPMMGQLSGMLGGLMSGMGAGGGGNAGGGAGMGLGNPVSGGNPANGQTYTYYVPQTIEQVSATVADILNMITGITVQSDQIASLTADQKEALYTALLDLMERTVTHPNFTTTVTADVDATNFYVTTPPYSGITPTEIVNGVPVSQIKTVTPIPAASLPGALIGYADVPTGYLEVFSFTDVDPYPGYIKWEGPNGELLFSPRPVDKPYSASPSEDAVNAGINILLDDLTRLIKINKTTINDFTNLLDNSSQAIQNQGINNSLGHNSNNNIMSMIQQLLGMLGQFIQQAESQHIQNSVLDKGSMQKTLENMSKQTGIAKKKKDLGKKVVQTKNPKPKKTDTGLNSAGSGNFTVSF